MLETDIGIAAYNHLQLHDALWCFQIEKLLIIIWKAVINLCNEGSICLYESYSIFISLIYRMMPDIDWHLKLHRKSKAWYNADSGACYVKTASETCHKAQSLMSPLCSGGAERAHCTCCDGGFWSVNATAQVTSFSLFSDVTVLETRRRIGRQNLLGQPVTLEPARGDHVPSVCLAWQLSCKCHQVCWCTLQLHPAQPPTSVNPYPQMSGTHS